MKKALVTGGSRGIGCGIVRCLAENGYDVAFSYVGSESAALALTSEIQASKGVSCFCFQVALQEKGAAETLFSEAASALGGIDLLVNNAGATKTESILEISDEVMDYTIALDLRAYLVLMREAARYMVANGTRGSIINITSTHGERAYPCDAVYGGVKAAVNRASQSAALDVAPYGIRVNCIAPGATRIRTAEELAAMENGPPLTFWDDMDAIIPLGRAGEPVDIGEAVVWLASERSGYITGVTLRVDGGLILPGMPEIIDTDAKGKGWGSNQVKI
jgi:NAD(P)-dependent dehydrogenase (short-subunit alcohol dehydrogenase family)